MSQLIKKSTELKLKLLKSIIQRTPFGYTLMEIYKKFKSEHKIGSRNTLKKYLNMLVDSGEVEIKIIGTYKIFRVKGKFDMRYLFQQYPHLENFTTQLFAAITNVLNDELEAKGKLIGLELAKSAPFLESKAIQQFKKFQDFFKILPFQQFIEKLSERTLLEYNKDVDFVAQETEARLIFKNTKLLRDRAWIFYYILAGIIEYDLNEIFGQNVTVFVDSINESQCEIKVKKA